MSTLKEETTEVEGGPVGQHAGVYEAFNDPHKPSSASHLTDNTNHSQDYNDKGKDNKNPYEQNDDNDEDDVDGSLSLSPTKEQQQQQRTIELHTATHDPRFTSPNQARRCFVSYCEYHKCIQEEGDEDRCRSYKQAYHSICPLEWIALWNELREEGRWFGKY
jgi:cytochrome c oxidase subunit 6b